MFEFLTKYNFYFNLSRLIDVLLALFVLFFFIRFIQYRNTIIREHEKENILAIAWRFINEPAWLFFSTSTARDHTGTFEFSFEEHKYLFQRAKLFYKVVAIFVLLKIALFAIQFFVFNKPLF